MKEMADSTSTDGKGSSVITSSLVSGVIPKRPTLRKQDVRLSDFESLMVGAIGGTIETTLQMPLITWKICVQEGRAYPTILREWYRGVFINASSLAPVTAVQCWANSLFQNVLLMGDTRQLEDWEMLGCSAAAGAVSAFIYGPVDLMVIQQQKMKASLLVAFSNIQRDYGALRVYRGLTAACIREAIYAMGYLGVAPVIQNRLTEANQTFADNYVMTSVLSAMIGGSFASVLSHPYDTAKTCIQSDLKGDMYPNTRVVMPMLYRDHGGLPVLFKGLIPRTLRLCGACFVISQVRQVMTHLKWQRLLDEDGQES